MFELLIVEHTNASINDIKYPCKTEVNLLAGYRIGF